MDRRAAAAIAEHEVRRGEPVDERALVSERAVEECEQTHLAKIGERHRALARTGEDLGERIVGRRGDAGLRGGAGDECDPGSPLGERILVDEAIDPGGERLLR